MKILVGLLIALIPTLAMSHSMTPGLEQRTVASRVFQMNYKLSNEYPHPASFKVEVFNKDFTPAEDWRTDKHTYNLNPNSKRIIPIRFLVEKSRKLIVCTTLIGVNKNENPDLISRVCSRLFLRSLR